jgi:hypothetical protein
MLASGDSGGPTFENGKLVGISSYGITLEYSFGPLPRTSDCTSQLDSSCGEFGGDTRVSFYSGWIDTIVGNSVVGPSNNPPTANDDSANVNEGDLVNIDLAANDSDSDDGLALGSISIVSAPSHGSVDVNVDGTVDYTHTGSDTTSDSFTYTIDDLSGASSNLATVDITVNAVVGSPPIKITSPGDGQTVSGKITISATVNVDGATVEFFVNGVSVGDSSGPSYQVTYHSKGMNTGANEIRAVILPLPVTDPTYEDIITVYKDGKSGSDDGGSSGSGPPPGKGKNK